MATNENLLFCQLMSDVKPITQDRIYDSSSSKNVDSAHLKRLNAEREASEHVNALTIEQDSIHFILPDDLISYKKEGVQDGVFRKLRLGKYPIEARLDLHRKTVKEAYEAVVRFVAQCQRLEVRTALIIHGRGERSQPPAILKSFVNHWLRYLPDIQCFHSAQLMHGGHGAVYFLLKKSQAKKSENREKHQKRMG